jgi:glycine cleavage system regulatory protein
VIGVERTRVTFLSYAEQNQADFTAELTAHLDPGSHIELIQHSFLAMAQRAS